MPGDPDGTAGIGLSLPRTHDSWLPGQAFGPDTGRSGRVYAAKSTAIPYEGSGWGRIWRGCGCRAEGRGRQRVGRADNTSVTSLLDSCSHLPVRSATAGETLIEEGAPAAELLVLRSGSIVVERDGVRFARIDHPGAVFGEMSWVLGRPATATVRAATVVEVHVMADPETFVAAHPEVAVAILRMTAARLDGLTQYLIDVKLQFADVEGHLGMVDGILNTLVHHQAPPTRPGSIRDPHV